MFYGDLFMKKYLINYIEDNKSKIKTIIIFIIVGIVLGILYFNVIALETKDELISSIKDVLNLSKEGNFEKLNIIINSSVTNLIIFLSIYISSLVIVAPCIISIISTLKGISIGFYMLTLLQIFGIKNGIIAILILIVIPSIVYIPTFIYMLIDSIKFHYNIFDKNLNFSILVKELYHIIMVISLIFLSIILEQSMSSVVINIWKSM